MYVHSKYSRSFFRPYRATKLAFEYLSHASTYRYVWAALKRWHMKRRHFLRTGLWAAGGMGVFAAVPMDLLAALRSGKPAGDTLGVGLIGCKGMGWSNLTSMLKMKEVNCLALCDIDEQVLRQRLADLDKLGIKPATYTDYRKMLERKDLDAVIIATPDHWHCLQMVDACAAGKHVYVEKPASNSVVEAYAMVAAAERYNRVVQVNQWQRSQQHFKDALAVVQSGKLGRIAQTKAWMYNGHGILPPQPDGAVPAGVDYDMWLGPATPRAFNANRFHYNFRWYWDYAGGLMTDWGVHLIDIVLMGLQPGLPQSVSSMGGHLSYPNDARETPDTQTALYQYDGFQLCWEHTMGRQHGLYGLGHGIAFVGEKGTLLLNRGGWELRPEMDQKTPRMEAIPWQPNVDYGLDEHTANFIDAVKTSDSSRLRCPIREGARAAIHCHLGNVAYRTGRTIQVSSAANGRAVVKGADAEALLTPQYHQGWKLPALQ